MPQNGKNDRCHFLQSLLTVMGFALQNSFLGFPNYGHHISEGSEVLQFLSFKWTWLLFFDSSFSAMQDIEAASFTLSAFMDSESELRYVRPIKLQSNSKILMGAPGTLPPPHKGEGLDHRVCELTELAHSPRSSSNFRSFITAELHLILGSINYAVQSLRLSDAPSSTSSQPRPLAGLSLTLNLNLSLLLCLPALSLPILSSFSPSPLPLLSLSLCTSCLPFFLPLPIPHFLLASIAHS